MGTRLLILAVALFAGIAQAPAESSGPPASTPPATRPASGLPAELTLTLSKTVSLKLVLVPAGKFQMGSPAAEAGRRDDEKIHEVTISRPFYLGVYTVTQEQYAAITGNNPSRVNRGDSYPVDSVSWDDAAAFCGAVAKLTGQRVGLPTEAQWEYACRAGSDTPFFCGSDEKKLREYANFWARTDLPVGKFKPNARGLYDMNGNVHQWVADWYGPYDDHAVSDPAGPDRGDRRVLRGGCFHNSAKFCRSASRVMYPPQEADYDFGFRVMVETREPAIPPSQ